MNESYITTAIPYVNGKPHLGHAMDYLLADVLRRYMMSQGKRVRLQAGTDEHGSKIYKKAIEQLEELTNKTFKSIYIIGGGAKNKYLNQLVKEYTNKEVVALPIEATSLGNIKVQMKASEEL